ncbi:hypothetical protein CG471_23965 [Sphingobium sp. IP1]|uniref:aminotransferase class V-fold PLP-dependent enzyme n=1 Tax=Sphingobium sp. IP1 TaxID=2021637 RepID=UPI000C06D1D4|nr:aminotransferase class V-fold PLP-dependent enzyme [Sphingobium sp. IP1]PHP17209.1 hypothetical protein CG471_23965 [Sphingobium sp. IP1]
MRLAAVDETGIVDLNALEALLGDGVDLASVMAVNYDVRTVQPIADIATTLAQGLDGLYHCDATQAVGSIPPRIGRDFDLATVSAHKVYGPQGIGAILATAQLFLFLPSITVVDLQLPIPDRVLGIPNQRSTIRPFGISAWMECRRLPLCRTRSCCRVACPSYAD